MRCSQLLISSAAFFLAFEILWGVPAFAQDPPDIAMGMTPSGTYHGGDFDFVDMGTGRLNLRIPLVVDHSQRGKLNFTYAVKYTSTGTWQYVYGSYPHIQPSKYGISGPSFVAEGTTAGAIYENYRNPYTGKQGSATWLIEEGYGVGALHPIAQNGMAIDGSGFHGHTNRDGVAIVGAGLGNVGASDPNGNQMTSDAGHYVGNEFITTMTDTLGRSWKSTSGVTDVTGCPTGGPVPPTTSTLWTIPGPSNTVRTFKFCYSIYKVQTNFTSPNCTEPQYSASPSLMTGIVLPDGTTWRLDYDNGSISYGDLMAVYPPTGGHISYTWTMSPNCSSDIAIRTVASRTVFDGINSSTWTYNWTQRPNMFTVTDPMLPVGNDITYTNVIGAVTQIQYYSGSRTAGTLLKTVNKTYMYPPNPFAGDIGPAGGSSPLLTTITTVWPNGQQTQDQLTYDSALIFTDTNQDHYPVGQSYTSTYGLITSETHSDFYTGNPKNPPLLSTIQTNYVALTHTSYMAANILDLPSSEITFDGSGNKCAEIDYGYDDPAKILGSGVTMQHLSAPAPGILGNLTSVTEQLFNNPCQSVNPSSTPITTTKYVYDTGMLQQSMDPLGNPTTYSYSGTYFGAYPTTVTNALNQSSTYTYDANTGLMTSHTDPNTRITTYAYDSMLRPTSESFPDGGQITATPIYNNGYFAGSTQSKKITASLNVVATTFFDGLGRQKETQLNSDPSGPVYTDVAYDGAGRKYRMWNPTRCSTANYPNQSNCGEMTWGFTTSLYDGLGRICLVVPQDATPPSGSPCPTTPPANNIFTSFSGNTTTVTDQAGKQRTSQSDGLGRLTSVSEDPNGANYQTKYTYDGLGNLLSVLQSGSRSRTFAYDSLSRLTSASNPESGTTTYTYDAGGNLLTKTDARGIMTNYSPADLPIDALNRVRKTTYSNGDPPVIYTYDGSGCLGQSPCYNVGHRTGMIDSAGSEAWSYDSMGRVAVDQRTTNGLTKTVTYSTATAPYNYDGSIAQLTYPSGRTITFKPNGAGQAVSAIDSVNGINYATLALYTPHGALSSLLNGSNVLSTRYYNSRLQPCRIAVNSSGTAPNACTDITNSGNVLDFNYSFNSGSSNNGNAAGIVNNRDTTRSQTFTYDALNRLLVGQTNSTFSTSPGHCWGETYVYDQANGPSPWGNLIQINPASSAYTGCTQESLNISVDNNNRINTAGFSYDSAGNLLTSPPAGTSFTYNAENRIKLAATSTATEYLYDGDGKRVEKTSGGAVYKIYWYGPNGSVLDESDGIGNITDEYVFFNGKRIARRLGP